jgi:hypothetical protein
MIPPLQKQMLDVLAQLCDRAPGTRFGQLLAHLGFLAEDRGAPGLWQVEDHDLLAAMEQHLAELARREQQVGKPEKMIVITPASSPPASQLEVR